MPQQHSLRWLVQLPTSVIGVRSSESATGDELVFLLHILFYYRNYLHVRQQIFIYVLALGLAQLFWD